jgi:hypothetical protein
MQPTVLEAPERPPSEAPPPPPLKAVKRDLYANQDTEVVEKLMVTTNVNGAAASIKGERRKSRLVELKSEAHSGPPSSVPTSWSQRQKDRYARKLPRMSLGMVVAANQFFGWYKQRSEVAGVRGRSTTVTGATGTGSKETGSDKKKPRGSSSMPSPVEGRSDSNVANSKVKQRRESKSPKPNAFETQASPKIIEFVDNCFKYAYLNNI